MFERNVSRSWAARAASFALLSAALACGGRASSEHDAPSNAAGTVGAAGSPAPAGGAPTQPGTAGAPTAAGAGGQPSAEAGAGGEPDAEGLPPCVNNPLAECQHCGTPVTLPSGASVCDCPEGSWGEHCEARSETIAMNDYQTCVLTSEGNVKCWGSNVGAQLPAVGPLHGLVAGFYQHCALDKAGTPHCWGLRSDFETIPLDDPPPGAFQQLSVGDHQACGLRADQTVECWGLPEAPPAKFASLAVGPVEGYRPCALTRAGRVECWTNMQSTVPYLEGTFQSLFVGGGATCGITAERRLSCVNPWEFPEDPPQGKYTSATLGQDHACALRTNGGMVCWGRGAYGAPRPMRGAFQSIATNHYAACGVHKDGSVQCLPNDPAVQPIESSPPSGVFTELSGFASSWCATRPDKTINCFIQSEATPAGYFAAIGPGNGFTCGIRPLGNLQCWGNNDYGQTNAPNGTFKSVSSGEGFACALGMDSLPKCWGSNEYNQLQAPAIPLKQISVGQSFACGLRQDDTIICWGDQRADYQPPTGTFQHLNVSVWHACALRTDGTAACWGENEHGEATAPSTVFTQLGVGLYHSCGLTPQGNVECWGGNEWHQADPAPGPYTSILGVGESTCGLRPNGRVECWGSVARPRQ